MANINRKVVSMVSRKRIVTLVGIVGVLIMAVFVTQKWRARLMIKSAMADHEKINVEILVKNKGGDGDYYSLTEDSVVSGEIEVMAEILDDGYSYMEYKINGLNYFMGYSPSYGVKINTGNLPDGWNQLLVVGYKDSDKIEGVKQIFFKVDNNSVKETRAPRQGQAYEVGEVPLYKKGYVPVLMYHDFQENITKEQESAVVHPGLFEEQLKVLLENEYTPINFNDLNLYLNGKGGLPPKPVIITADDGYLSNYEIAFPILEKYNVPATFFVTTKYVGVDTTMQHFTWEQAKEMEDSGLIDIQSHSHGHLLLNKIPDNEMRHQVDASFGFIEKNLGKRDVKVLAYPQFYYSKHTKEILVEEGVDFQITKLGKWYKATTEPTNIQRIHVANDTSPEDLIKAIKKLTR